MVLREQDPGFFGDPAPLDQVLCVFAVCEAEEQVGEEAMNKHERVAAD